MNTMFMFGMLMNALYVERASRAEFATR